MKYERITVNPGDLGKRFLLLEGWRNANNRPLSEKFAKELAKDAESVASQSILVLHRDPKKKDRYYILDGQHRIMMASNFRNKPTTFEVQVREEGDFNDSISVQVEKLNRGRPFRTPAHLANTQAESKWPDIFAEYGLTPTYNNGRSKLTWPSIIRARIAANSCARDGRMPAGTANLTQILELWRTDDEDMIRETAEIMAWWEPGATAVAKMKVYTLRSYLGLTFAILLWEENSDKPWLLKAPMRLVDFNEIALIKGLPHSRVRELFHLLIRGVNYKRQTRLLTILGETGRNPLPYR